MTFDDYSHDANLTKTYSPHIQLIYPAIGLFGEVGELANKLKKILKKHQNLNRPLCILDFTPGEIRQVLDELGDCLWYLNAVCLDMGFTLNQVATENLIKLHERYSVKT